MLKQNFWKRTAALLLSLLMLPILSAHAAAPSGGNALSKTAEQPAFEEGEYVESPEDTAIDWAGVFGMKGVKAPSIYSDFSVIRVKLTIGSTTSVDLDLYGGYCVSDRTEPLLSSLGSPIPIRVSAGGGVITVTNRLTNEILTSGSAVELTRIDSSYEAGYVQITSCANSHTLDRKYLGNFTFSVDSGNLLMINTVPMAYYIYGIIGYELSPSSQPEALKAQAVAAKSFGMYFMDPSAPFDVQDGWASSLYQAYRGFREDRLSTMQYCLEVIGEALSFCDTFIPTCYGHSNGGETALPSQIFGGSIYDGGFEVVFDDIEVEHDTSKELIHVDFGGTGDSSRFRDFILLKVRDLFEVEPLSIVSIDDLYTFDPLPGTERNMRQLHVGATVELLMAQKDDPDPTAEPTPEPTPTITTFSFSFNCPVTQLKSYALSDIDGSGDNYSSKKYVFSQPYSMYWGWDTDGGYTLIYSRYGHGIGLSQMGADVRANPAIMGWDYHSILEFYFPNFDIISICENSPSDPDNPSAPVYPVVAYGVCTSNGINFRTGPGANFDVIGTVNRNEHIDILGVTDTGWFNAVWNGHTGYITMDYSRIVMFPSPTNGVFTLTDGAVTSPSNLRAEPCVRSGNVITVLPAGTRFTGWTHIGKWYYVTTENGYTGFLSSVVAEFYGSYQYIGVVSLDVDNSYLDNRRFSGGGDAALSRVNG